MVEGENKKTMLRNEEKAMVEGENKKKNMLRDEEKAMVEGENKKNHVEG